MLFTPDDEAARAELHRTIFEELCAEKVRPSSQDVARGVIADLEAKGAPAIALSYTALMLLFKRENSQFACVRYDCASLRGCY